MKFKNLIEKREINIDDVDQLLDNNALLTLTDLEGKILFASQKFLEQVGYSRNEVIGKTHRIFKSGSHSNEFYRELWNTILKKKQWKGSILNRTKSGKNIWLKTIIIPITKNGKITHFAALRNDITEHVEAAKQLTIAQKAMKEHNLSLKQELEKNKELMKLQKMSSIGHLASRIAHDMRNPLQVITTSLENIRVVYGDQPELDESFKRIQRAIKRMSRQIDDVLDFVRERPLQKEPLNLQKIISEILSTLEIPSSIKLELELQNITIEFDKQMFDVLIKNLVTNSIQACNNKGKISIRTKPVGSHIIIEIEDSGPGIPPDKLEKIFEPLFTTKQSGTGLGLSSCKTIVEQHGGTISAKPFPTIFTIKLPSFSQTQPNLTN